MNLEELRREIDHIDADIVRLLNKRTEFAVQIGHIKKTENIPVFVPGREQKLLSRLGELNGGPLPQESLRHIYREIISAARSIEGGLIVAHTASSAAAARTKFGGSVSYLRCTSPAEAKKAIGSRAQLAVLPARWSNGNAIDEFDNGGKRFAVLAETK